MSDAVERGKLIDYLPDFMKQFIEIKEIMQAEDKEMDEIDFNIQRALDNAFIEGCDEYGISKYEALLGITVRQQESLGVRKTRVLSRWNDFQPCTYRRLLKKLDILCGTGNYRVDGSLEDYQLCIGISGKALGVRGELEEMLKKMLPENINYEIFEEHPVTGHICTGAVMQQAEIMDIRQVI
ncbi:putative phage tail protein [Lachnospiraceae bacterium 46-15]